MSLLLATTANSKVYEYELENKLKILVKEDHRTPVVSSQLWYKVGSSYEVPGQTGISHLLQHMMARGTNSISSETFQKVIAEKGGVQDAFSSFDYTCYHHDIPATALAISFRLEADRMHNLLLEEKDFVTEKQLLKEERLLRMEINPIEMGWERFFAAAFPGSSYQNPTIGWNHDIEQMTLPELQQWYSSWYAPNNAVLVVVGDVKAEEVYNLANQYFGHIAPKGLTEVPVSKVAPTFGHRKIEVEFTGRVPYLFLGYNVPSLNTVQESWEIYALHLLSHILSLGESSRFATQLKMANIAAEADCGYRPFRKHSGLLVLSGVPAKDKCLAELETGFVEQVDRLKKELVSNAELAKVKANTTARFYYEQDSLYLQGYHLGKFVAAGYNWELLEAQMEEINAITKEQIQAVAQKYLTKDRLTIAYLMPKKIVKKENK